MADKPDTHEEQTAAAPEKPDNRFSRRLQRVWRRLENIAFVLVLVLIVLYFILQSAAVQNWLIGKITGYLSKELETTVAIQHVDISLFDNLILEGLYVADRKGDTLLFAESFRAGLNSNIFSLFSNKLEFNDIGLTHARFNIRRAEGESENNLQFLIDYFSSPTPKPKPEPTPFRIRVHNLRLNDVHFLQEDLVQGKRMEATVNRGVIRINNLDLASNIVDIQSVRLDGAFFAIADYPDKPLTGTKAKPLPTSNKHPVPDSTSSPSSRPLQLQIGALSLKNSRFSLDRFDVSPSRTALQDVMDYNHIDVRKIEVDAEKIHANDDLAFEGKLLHLAGREQSGVEIVHLEAGDVYVNDTLAALYGMRLQTPGSTLGDSIAFHYKTYRDFKDFNNRITMVGRLATGSKVRLGDIMYFSQEVAQNSIFMRNREEVIDITGNVDGRVNRLNGRNLELHLGDNTFIKGGFDGNDMAEGSDRIRLLFDLREAQFNMRTIRKIIPGFTAPDYFDRLGNVKFNGTYQIFFSTNHIIAGDLITDLGTGKLDMKLDLAGGREKATYSGLLNLNNFNLAQWTGNSDFGKSTFRFKIDDGTGLTLRTIKARLDGVVDSFYFKGYNYRNVEMDGIFNKSVFSGQLKMEDPNIDFTFDGTVNLKDTIPEYDFKADLRRLDLGALNLVKEDWVLSGNIEKIKLFARNWNSLSGSIMLRDFRLIQDKQYVHKIDSLRFVAQNQSDGNRLFGLYSDIANGILTGRFEVNQMARNALYFLYQYYPELTRQAYGGALPDTFALTDNYKLNILIKNTRGLTRLFDPKLDTLQNIYVQAQVNSSNGFASLDLQVPALRYNGIYFRESSFSWTNAASQGKYALHIPYAILANGQKLAHLDLTGQATRDQIAFLLTTEDTASIIERMRLNGVLSTTQDSLWQIKFNTSEITLFSESWYMDEDNYLRFSGNYFDARNFDLMNGDQRIVIDPFNEGRGALFSLANFDLSFFRRFVNAGDLQFRGKIYNLDVELYDLFGVKDMRGYITTDTVFLNERPYGTLAGNVELNSLDSALWCKLFLNDKDKTLLRLLGVWAQDGKRDYQNGELGKVRAGEFQANVTVDDFPLEVLELFVPGISKTQGTIKAESIRLGGPFSRFGVNGVAAVDGKFQLDYLKAMFYMQHQKITLSDYQIWADGDTILDGSQRNMALVRGGLRHDHFKDWKLDCDIKTVGDNFLALNTLRSDNDMYYGQGIGWFEARFTGTFSKTNINIDAITGKETRLYIPLSSTSDVQDASFINFRSGADNTSESRFKTNRFVSEDLKGLNFEMNLSITDAAEVQIIFDEQAGDIIKGRGEGNIRLVINREGEFKMYGNYEIRRGEYLFTLLNWVNKPFTVAEGGSINWYGDPYGAQISLDATYAENTSLYNLLRDELTLTNSLSAEATKSTRAVVTMHLKGDLFKPNISFDLSFPNVTSSQLKSLVDSKLTLLRQDQNELTRQVFGLVVVGSFLPPSSGGAGTLQSSDYLASAFNTLTQVLSNQFSSYLTGLATEWFGGTVSSIDFDIAYNEYRNQTNPGQSDLAQIGRELQVRLTSGFVNDRITVQVGSQFGLGQPGTVTNDGFLGEDVTVEIQLTENRQWRLKVYQRTEPDIAGGSRRSRYGFGISFRKEYDSFGDLMSGLTGWITNKKS